MSPAEVIGALRDLRDQVTRMALADHFEERGLMDSAAIWRDYVCCPWCHAALYGAEYPTPHALNPDYWHLERKLHYETCEWAQSCGFGPPL